MKLCPTCSRTLEFHPRVKDAPSLLTAIDGVFYHAGVCEAEALGKNPRAKITAQPLPVDLEEAA